MEHNRLYHLLESKYKHYATSAFIENDPISIPHQFHQKQDIEIAGFFAAIFAWGRRDIIIKKTAELMKLMANQPHQFILNYHPKDFKNIEFFKHRTFNNSDLDFFCRAFQRHYSSHESLESAFQGTSIRTIEVNLAYFYQYITSLVPSEKRNLKHISTPLTKAACKRLCMYLRWMVRKDNVDFGIWKSISTSQLVMPLDIHVINTARHLRLIEHSEKSEWKTALNLTENLKTFDTNDPVKYDLALFSLGEQKELV